jgi:cation:H+ antiporter
LRTAARGALAAEFAVTDTSGRWILSGIHLVLGIGFLGSYRREILPTLIAPFRRITAIRPEPDPVSEETR